MANDSNTRIRITSTSDIYNNNNLTARCYTSSSATSISNLRITTSVQSMYGNDFYIYQNATISGRTSLITSDFTKYRFTFIDTANDNVDIEYGSDIVLDSVDVDDTYTAGIWHFIIPSTSKYYHTATGYFRITGYEEIPSDSISITVSGNNFSVSPLTVTNGNETLLTVKSDDNYIFTGEPTISYSGDDTISGSFTKVSDSEYTFTFNQTLTDTSGTITITADAEKAISIITSGSNFTVSPTSVINGVETLITINADDGYSFSDVPTIQYSSSGTISGDFVKVSDSEYTFTYSTLFTTDNGVITISANTYAVTSITVSISGDNFSVTPSSVTNGSETLITVKSDDNYAFTDEPTISYSGDDAISGSFTKVSDSEYTFTFNQTLTDTSGTITITAQTTEIKLQINTNGSHFTMAPYEEDDVYSDTLFVIMSDSGYKFSDAPTYTYVGDNEFNATITKIDDTTYTMEFDVSTTEIAGVITVTATTEIISSVLSKFGNLNGYKVSSDKMIELSPYLYIEVGTTSGVSVTDRTKFIMRYSHIIFDVATYETSTIVLGSYDSQVETDVLSDYKVIFDLGTIEIKGIYQNNLDYLYSDIKISLCGVGIRELDTSKIINKSIEIVCEVNLLTLRCEYRIVHNGIVIYTFNGIIGFNIPYNVSFDRVNNSNIDDNIPIIDNNIMVYQKDVSNENEKVFNTDKYDLISNENGYFESDRIDFIDFDSEITENEISEIRALLLNGVYK